jgi:cyclopropane fatty-acyl-phospholipid synthase-like methyltransferase
MENSASLGYPAIAQQQIIDYYDHCQVDYSIVWHLKTHLSMHYGYWDKDVKNLRGALLRLNDELATRATISSSDVVLDAGCGVGGSSIHLAAKYGCKTTGITLSEKQAAFATAQAANKELSHKVDFLVNDFTATNFPDESFDVVWAIESVCHANEKADFLKEAFRVLKKGGRLIMADFFRNAQEPNAEGKYWLDKWAASWAVPEFEYDKVFVDKAWRTGFSSVELDDVTENILPSAKRLYYYFIPGVICDGTLRILGKRKLENRSNVWSTYYQYQALKRGFWNYHIIKATK